MKQMEDDLEQSIRGALRHRADSLPTARAVAPPVAMVEHRTRRRPKALVLAVAAALIMVFTAWAIVSISKSDPTRVGSGQSSTVPPATESTALPAPITGTEVPLSEVNSDDIARIENGLQRSEFAPTSFFAVQIPDRSPVIVYRNEGTSCMLVTAAPVPAAGSQGACVPSADAASNVVGALDTGPVELPTTLAYGVWTDVPDEAAYVTFSYGTTNYWQRPLHGISYFTINGARPSLGPEPVTMRAYDAGGNELAQATRAPFQDGVGDWRW
jgi:hypothetical protein